MNVWTTPDRHAAKVEAAVRRASTYDLVAEIRDALAVAGHYAARVETEPRQRMVDFTWAAHQAGRELGRSARVDLQMSTLAADGLYRGTRHTAADGRMTTKTAHRCR